MINRVLSSYITSLGRSYPVITMTGPRQSGKTTLCRALFQDLPYINLENTDTREFATTDPRGFLAGIPKGAVLDEIQRTPDLPSYIQGIVDEPDFQGLFVLTGSRNFAVRQAVNQSLAGRTAVLNLLPFSLRELEDTGITLSHDDYLYMGGYPRIFDKKLEPRRFYADYVNTYIERDLRSMSLIKDLSSFMIFLRLCAGRTGQLLNIDNLANDTGISHTTAREWLSLLEASYLIFKLPPFYKNLGKRLVKSPKFYFYDCGLAAHLIGISDSTQLKTHPLRGPLFETLVVSEVVKSRFNYGYANDLLFYRDSNNNEVDLIIPQANTYTAMEIKSGATISTNFFKGLKNFRKASGTRGKSILVYGGDDSRVQFDTHVTGIHGLGRLLAGDGERR